MMECLYYIFTVSPYNNNSQQVWNPFYIFHEDDKMDKIFFVSLDIK